MQNCFIHRRKKIPATASFPFFQLLAAHASWTIPTLWRHKRSQKGKVITYFKNICMLLWVQVDVQYGILLGSLGNWIAMSIKSPIWKFCWASVIESSSPRLPATVWPTSFSLQQNASSNTMQFVAKCMAKYDSVATLGNALQFLHEG